jgi:hypothetical protein
LDVLFQKHHDLDQTPLGPAMLVFSRASARKCLRASAPIATLSACSSDSVLMHFLRQPLLKGFFPVQEEIGARGAEKYDAEFMQNVGYAIEFDSPSNTSSITLGGKLMYNPSDENGLGIIFTKLLLEFSEKRETEFTLEQHSYTDIVKLRPHFSCVNVPVGYYLYHTTSEYLLEEEAFFALDIGEELIKRAGYRYYNDAPHPSVSRLITQFALNTMEIIGEL